MLVSHLEMRIFSVQLSFIQLNIGVFVLSGLIFYSSKTVGSWIIQFDWFLFSLHDDETIITAIKLWKIIKGQWCGGE